MLSCQRKIGVFDQIIFIFDFTQSKHMNYALLAPPKSLQKLVKCFWMIESSSDFCPDKNYMMADTSPEIIFQYKGGFKLYAKQQAYIRVQHANSHNLALENEFGFFGVRLFPGSVQHLMTIPAHELSGYGRDDDAPEDQDHLVLPEVQQYQLDRERPVKGKPE